MKSVIGICNLHDCPHLGPLTQNRPMGAVTFLGRYALMDFALSNFTNSGIDKILLLAKSNVAAILSHTGDGHSWINNTKTGYLRILNNESAISNYRFNTDVCNILSNLDHIDIDADNIIVTNPFFIGCIDFNELIKEHEKTGAEVTVLYKKVNNADEEYLNCDTLELENGKILAVGENSGRKKENDISLESFIFTKDAFDKIVDSMKEVSTVFSLRRLLNHAINNGKIDARALAFNDSIFPILSLNHYIDYSFKLLEYDYRVQLFKDNWPIYTTTHNTPPVKYGPKAKVRNSFIANGSVINGTVENSILSRDVRVAEGAVIKNSILFTGTEVGKKVHLTYVLSDKQAKCYETKEISGSKENIFFLHLKERV